MELATMIFESYDFDKNGELDKDEFSKLLSDIFNKYRKSKLKVPEQQVNMWFNQVDADHNGMVSFDEVMSFLNDEKG